MLCHPFGGGWQAQVQLDGVQLEGVQAEHY